MGQNEIYTNKISIIIPVKNNQKGIENFLNSFFKTQKKEAYPLEIIIVDNNSIPSIKIPVYYQSFGIPIHLLKCSKIGPASARNMGVNFAKGDWLFFTDSDCVFTATSIVGYLNAKDGGVAYAGRLLPLKKNLISNYYQRINLLNPSINEENNNQINYIITANCLVQKIAFENVSGFNEEFKLASGEDVDLGLRLAKVGKLYFVSQSLVKHDFENNLIDFYKRFYRYGIELLRLEKIHNISISIDEITPKNQSGIYFFLTILLKIAIKKGKNRFS